MTAAGGAALHLCRLDDLDEGQARGFRVAGLAHKVIVVRKGAKAHAYLDSCPHYEPGTPMAWKTDAYLNGDGTRLACHSHGAQFEIETGECVIGPCLGRSLTRVPLRITGDGGVEAVIEVQRGEFA